MVKLDKVLSVPRRPKLAPQGSTGYDNPRDNIDPYVKTKATATKQGTIEDAPVNAKDIVNKEYVDAQFPVTHASTTGQTTDDHHNESHAYNSHTGTLDISAETNLAVTSPIVLTDDTLSFDFNVANTWTADQTFNDNVEIKMGTAGADGSIYSDGGQIIISGNTKLYSDKSLSFRDTQATLKSPSSGTLRYTVTGLGAKHEWYSGAAELMRVGTRVQLGGATNYIGVALGGNVTFNGTAGFYPRFLTQSAKPAAGTGATQLDTSEMCIWKDSDDSTVYFCFNDGGTVKTVQLT